MDNKEFKCHQFAALQLFNHLQRDCYISRLSEINYGKNITNQQILDDIIVDCMSFNNKTESQKNFKLSLYYNYINNYCNC